MRKLSLSPFFFIQLFAEGGDGGTEAGATGQTSAAPAQPQETGAKGESLADVRYGKQEEAPAAGEQTVKQPVDRNAEFEALIKGDYKQAFEDRVKDVISKRLKGNEETVAKYNKIAEHFDLFESKYGLDASAPDFVDKLVAEIVKDEGYFENEALEKGMTVEQVKELHKIKRENREMREQLNQHSTQEQADKLYASWMQQAERVKQVYPAFDLQAEMQNEQFRNLLSSNVPIQTAFEVIHKDEIIPAAMQFTAKQVEQKVANNVRAGKGRPAEGAMGNQSAAVYKSDVSQLTDADLAEINRRVMRGEKIRF